MGDDYFKLRPWIAFPQMDGQMWVVAGPEKPNGKRDKIALFPMALSPEEQKARAEYIAALEREVEIAVNGWAFQMCWADSHEKAPENRPCPFHLKHTREQFDEARAAAKKETK